jgi:hypothetical protein
MKGTILQEEISILNIYSPNAGAPIYIKKKKKKKNPGARAWLKWLSTGLACFRP